VAATFYTILETAKLHGVNPAAYLAAAVTAADRGIARAASRRASLVLDLASVRCGRAG